MKQFIAVLKDSYREARDGWIIYMMLAFSVLVILLVASITYRPMTMEQVVNKGPERFNSLVGLFVQPGQPKPPKLAIENFRQTNDAVEPWFGDYSWDFVVVFASEKDAVEGKKNFPLAQLEFVRDNMYRNDKTFYFLNDIDIEQAEPSPTQVRFHLSTKGTKVDNRRAWPHDVKLLYGIPMSWLLGNNVEEAVYTIEKWVIHKVGAWLAIMVGLVITAFFIPNLMRKGSVDLVISKPIHRWVLLLYKYAGGLTFMLLTSVITVLGVWVVVGIRSGVWGPGFLWVMPGIVFYFAILYSVSVLMGTLTRSPIVAILVTFTVWGFLYANGLLHNIVVRERTEKAVMGAELKPEQDQNQKDGNGEKKPRRGPPKMMEILGIPDWVSITSDVIHAILPRTSDLDDLNGKLIAESVLSKPEQKRLEVANLAYPPWIEVFTISLGFIAVMLGLSCWRFSTRDH